MSPEQCIAWIERDRERKQIRQWAWDMRKMSPLNVELMLRWRVPEQHRQAVRDQVKYLKKKHNWIDKEET